MCGIDFSKNTGYISCGIFDIPKDEYGGEKIDLKTNLYAGVILQPLINIRNNVAL